MIKAAAPTVSSQLFVLFKTMRNIVLFRTKSYEGFGFSATGMFLTLVLGPRDRPLPPVRPVAYHQSSRPLVPDRFSKFQKARRGFLHLSEPRSIQNAADCISVEQLLRNGLTLHSKEAKDPPLFL